ADKEVTYQIVGPHEADAGQGRLSVDSPIAKALIGRSVGDISDVTTPGGSKSYEVVSIEITR
ncbi:MAG: GreA/GreB family elongation factor, partial [Alphaproteobacteria bacterium]